MKSSTKYLKIGLNFIIAVLALFACLWLIPKVLRFFTPFVIAALIALLTNPLIRFMEKYIKVRRKAGGVVVIILALALVVFASYLVISLLVTEISGLAMTLPDTWTSISSTIREANMSLTRTLGKMPKGFQSWADSVSTGISDSLTGWITLMGEKAADVASSLMKNLPLTIVGIIMCILASYTFVADRDYISDKVARLIPETVVERLKMVWNTVLSAVGGYFKAQFKIMCFVYIILFAGFLILGIKYAFLIALLIAFLDFLPFFGTGAVMWPWAVVAFMQKNYKLAIGMMIVWAVSQVVRQLIQPKLLGDSVGMHPIPTLFLLYIGFRLGGALGLIVAVPIGMIIENLYKAGMFSNLSYSMKILINDIGKFRKFTDEELKAEGLKAEELKAEERTADGPAKEENSEDKVV